MQAYIYIQGFCLFSPLLSALRAVLVKMFGWSSYWQQNGAVLEKKEEDCAPWDLPRMCFFVAVYGSHFTEHIDTKSCLPLALKLLSAKRGTISILRCSITSLLY